MQQNDSLADGQALVSMATRLAVDKLVHCDRHTGHLELGLGHGGAMLVLTKLDVHRALASTGSFFQVHDPHCSPALLPILVGSLESGERWWWCVCASVCP